MVSKERSEIALVPVWGKPEVQDVVCFCFRTAVVMALNHAHIASIPPPIAVTIACAQPQSRRKKTGFGEGVCIGMKPWKRSGLASCGVDMLRPQSAGFRIVASWKYTVFPTVERLRSNRLKLKLRSAKGKVHFVDAALRLPRGLVASILPHINPAPVPSHHTCSCAMVPSSSSRCRH